MNTHGSDESFTRCTLTKTICQIAASCCCCKKANNHPKTNQKNQTTSTQAINSFRDPTAAIIEATRDWLPFLLNRMQEVYLPCRVLIVRATFRNVSLLNTHSASPPLLRLLHTTRYSTWQTDSKKKRVVLCANPPNGDYRTNNAMRSSVLVLWTCLLSLSDGWGRCLIVSLFNWRDTKSHTLFVIS